MQQGSIREKFGQYAGGAFALANTGVTFKGLIEAELNDLPFQMENLYAADPLTFGMGVTLLTGSVLMAAKGDDNKMVTGFLGLTTVGRSILAYKTFQDHLSLGSKAGALTALGLVAYNTYTSYKRQNDPDVNAPVADIAPEQDSKVSVWDNFKGTIKDITRDYPNAIAAFSSLTPNMLVAVGYAQAHNPVMTTIATLWSIGSAFMTLSLPKVEPSADTNTPKPA